MAYMTVTKHLWKLISVLLELLSLLMTLFTISLELIPLVSLIKLILESSVITYWTYMGQLYKSLSLLV